MRKVLMISLKVLAAVVALIAVLLILGEFLIPTIPPVDLTRTNMTVMAVRAWIYLRKHGCLPQGSADLPTRENYDNSIDDGWGRNIIYMIGPDHTITLRSLGRDGRPGGSGEDADITRFFKVSQEKVTAFRAPSCDEG